MRKCGQCMKPLTLHQQNYNQMYCSRKCANTARRGVKMGKGHKTDIIKLARGGATTHMIMERLNIPKGTVAYHLTRAREDGVDLPNVPTGGQAHRSRQKGQKKCD
jgi:hypothetical protein